MKITIAQILNYIDVVIRKKRMSRLQQPSKVASDFGVLQQLEIGEQVRHYSYVKLFICM